MMLTENTLFIFEFVAGGGFNNVEVPPHLFCEGYAMLRSIALDFKRMNFNVITIIDARITFLSKYLCVDRYESVSSDKSFIDVFIDGVNRCEYCFIIAPEFSNILFDLTKLALNLNKIVLSADLSGIELGTSKLKTFNYFNRQKILTPRTYPIPRKKELLDYNFILKKYEELSCPIIIKPEDGIGSENIFYLHDEQKIKDFINMKGNILEGKRNYILQEFINGIDLSASFIGISQNSSNIASTPILLGINSQSIQIKEFEEESEYIGGSTPARHGEKIYLDLIELAENSPIPLSGYYGVDFVRSKTCKNYYIEINPRLTTSYVGIRNVIDVNPAELIYDAKLSKEIYKKPRYTHHSTFYRIEMQYSCENSKTDPYEDQIPILMNLIPEIVTPPISNRQLGHGGDHNYSCFISTKEKTQKKSLKRINEIYKIFKKRNFLVFK
ncbi:MAG: ATP-grasp domain-containing protein [Candidatus Lokiarchaeota archaeon]|nr:ATP-grasp domain-containing protein [Candidatus Lokiarchaeota archaeon]